MRGVVLALGVVWLLQCAHARRNLDKDGVFEIGGLFQASSGSDSARTCASRRGFAECTVLGQDCEDVSTATGTQRSFPLKDWTVSFPCSDEFPRPPMVFTSVLGPPGTKMYSASVHSVTGSSFSVYVQRTDDVASTEPDQCGEIRLCYVALVV